MVGALAETNTSGSFELTPQIGAEINQQTGCLLFGIKGTSPSETTIAQARQILSRFCPYFGSGPPREYQMCFGKSHLHHLITTRSGFNLSDAEVIGYNDFDLEKDLPRDEALLWFNREILTRIAKGMIP